MDSPGSYKLGFTSTQDEQLVETVQIHRYLYDLHHPLHNDHPTRDLAWQEISDILERRVEDCKRRWKNIKDAHRRRKKLGKYGGPPKSALAKLLTFLDNVPSRKHKSSKRLGKNAHIKNENEAQRSSCSAINLKCEKQEEEDSMDHTTNNEVVSEDEAEVIMECPDPLSTLQRTFQQENQDEKSHNNSNLDENTLSITTDDIKMLKSIVEKQEDSIDLFFRSLAMSVKNLPPHLIHQAKIKMLQIVHDLETDYSDDDEKLNSK